MRTRKRQLEPVDSGSGCSSSHKPKKSRQSTRMKNNFLVGNSAKMTSVMLPLRIDVLKHLLYLQEKKLQNTKIDSLISCQLGVGFR